MALVTVTDDDDDGCLLNSRCRPIVELGIGRVEMSDTTVSEVALHDDELDGGGDSQSSSSSFFSGPGTSTELLVQRNAFRTVTC